MCALWLQRHFITSRSLNKLDPRGESCVTQTLRTRGWLAPQRGEQGRLRTGSLTGRFCSFEGRCDGLPHTAKGPTPWHKEQDTLSLREETELQDRGGPDGDRVGLPCTTWAVSGPVTLRLQGFSQGHS